MRSPSSKPSKSSSGKASEAGPGREDLGNDRKEVPALIAIFSPTQSLSCLNDGLAVGAGRYGLQQVKENNLARSR